MKVSMYLFYNKHNTQWCCQQLCMYKKGDARGRPLFSSVFTFCCVFL